MFVRVSNLSTLKPVLEEGRRNEMGVVHEQSKKQARNIQQLNSENKFSYSFPFLKMQNLGFS